MSILSSFKKALGFPDEYDEEPEASDHDKDRDHESDGAQSTLTVQSGETDSQPSTHREVDTQSQAAQLPADLLSDPQLPSEVLDAVIEQFNETQPDFVRQCLSIPQQRAYLIRRMSESLRTKLQTEAENARLAGLRQCEDERAKMAREIEKFKSDRATISRQKDELKNAQLSATRQKRALNDRIRDLEQQVVQLEADKEQFQLENRGLINKLRVAGVKSNLNGDSELEVDRLARENISLADRVKELESQLEQSQKAVKEAEEAAANSAPELQQEMIDEIEQKLTEFEEVKRKKDKRIAQLNSEINQARSTIDTLNADNLRLSGEIDRLNDHANQLNSQIDQLNSKAADPTEIELKDSEIKSLRDEIKRLTDMINAAEKPMSRRKKKNRPANRETDQPLHHAPETLQIEMLSQEAETSDGQQTERPKVSAIDELMDSTDWFTAPEPVPLKKDPEVDELFGYKEPQRKPAHIDDKQLSLF